MSRISVRLFAGAAEAFGRQETEVEEVSNLSGLVKSLAGEDVELREVLDQCSFFVNGEHVKSLDLELPEDCRVDVLPPFAGG